MKPDLRIPFAAFARAANDVEKLNALFARVDPAMDEACEDDAVESALGRLTPGQRALWAVLALQLEVGNGGLDQFFLGAAGDAAQEALEGLRLLKLKALEGIFARALQVFPGGVAPRDREKREALLGDDVPEEFDDLEEEFDDAIHEGDSVYEACLAYVAAHPAEFFLDAA